MLTSLQYCNPSVQSPFPGPLVSSLAGSWEYSLYVAPDASGYAYASGWLGSSALIKISPTGALSPGFGTSSFHYNTGLYYENSGNPGLWFLSYFANGGTSSTSGTLYKIFFSSPGVYSTFSQIGPTNGNSVSGLGVDSINLWVYWGDSNILHKMTTTGSALTSWSVGNPVSDIAVDPTNYNVYVSPWGSGLIAYTNTGTQLWS